MPKSSGTSISKSRSHRLQLLQLQLEQLLLAQTARLAALLLRLLLCLLLRQIRRELPKERDLPQQQQTVRCCSESDFIRSRACNG